MKQQIQENEYTNREYYRNVSSKKQEIEKNKETRKTYISSLYYHVCKVQHIV